MASQREKVERLRELLKADGIIVAPGVTDAISARLAQAMGFKAIYLGGFTMGQAWGMSEPLMTMTETVQYARYIAEAVDIPLIVDGNGGFGDLLQTRRAVREFINAGVAAIHIEDQWFPKRARYFENYKHTIPLEEAKEKLRHALDARGDDDLVIIARTDVREAQGGSLEEALERCRAFHEVGADVLMPYATCAPTEEEAAYVAANLKAPLLYVSSEGKTEHVKLDVATLEAQGWKIVLFNIAAQLVQYQATRDLYQHLLDHGASNLDLETGARLRQEVGDLTGLQEMYQIERESIRG